jgi:uncharacterized protein
MSIDVIKQTVEWLKDFKDDSVTFTFHGGEPLLAGADFYREALPLLSDGLRHLGVSYAMQTNLWKLTPELAVVLAEHDIPIGSSIDGPMDINDVQRGKGYFEKTMKGFELAKQFGLRVQFICTFTSQSVKSKEEIFDFFLQNGITLKLHPALPSLRDSAPDRWALAPPDYGELLVFLLDKYLENLGKIEIRNINDICRSVFSGRGTVCTFADCMGTTFAVGPNGSIYPCYRFVGMPEYVMGNVRDRPGVEDLSQSHGWKMMFQYKEHVDKACKGCSHIKYCRGGCPYNAIVPNDGEIKGVDPHCIAYKRIFGEITDRFNKEFFGGACFGLPGQNQAASSRSNSIMPLMRRIINR